MPPIDRLFTADVLERLARLQRPRAAINGRDISERYRILASGGPNGTTGERALLSAWTNYIEAGEGCGLLDADVVARLTGDSDEGFRSALSECEAAWFLGNAMHAEVRPRPEPPTARGVDLLAVRAQREVYVEVKAPYVERPPHGWAGDDADALVQSIREAAKQFREGRANLVFLVPVLRAEVFLDRGQLLKATIGEPVLVVPVLWMILQQPIAISIFGKMAGSLVGIATSTTAVSSLSIPESALSCPWSIGGANSMMIHAKCVTRSWWFITRTRWFRLSPSFLGTCRSGCGPATPWGGTTTTAGPESSSNEHAFGWKALRTSYAIR